MINTEWQLLLIPDKSPRDPFFSVQSSRCIVFLVLNFLKKKKATHKSFFFFFYFMKWILYCVRRKGKVHKLYTHCFANTIIRVCTDHCFVGLNNCLLVIAVFPGFPPPFLPSLFLFLLLLLLQISASHSTGDWFEHLVKLPQAFGIPVHTALQRVSFCTEKKMWFNKPQLPCSLTLGLLEFLIWIKLTLDNCVLSGIFKN